VSNSGASILLGALCFGCVATADSISVIRGHLVQSDGVDLNGCTALPYLSEVQEPYSKYERVVDSRFFVSLVNAPRAGTAYLEFRCPGVPGAVKTDAFSLKQASEQNGVDIGRVVIGR
jgi:hypothetical protein